MSWKNRRESAESWSRKRDFEHHIPSVNGVDPEHFPSLKQHMCHASQIPARSSKQHVEPERHVLAEILARDRSTMASPLPTTCQSCGQPLTIGSRFCAHCGAPVIAQNMTPPSPRTLRTPRLTRPWIIALIVIAMVVVSSVIVVAWTIAGQSVQSVNSGPFCETQSTSSSTITAVVGLRNTGSADVSGTWHVSEDFGGGVVLTASNSFIVRAGETTYITFVFPYSQSQVSQLSGATSVTSTITKDDSAYLFSFHSQTTRYISSTSPSLPNC